MAHLDRSCTYLKLSEADFARLYERASLEQLQQDIAIAASSPVVDGLMRSVGGMFAILNTYRQIVAVNDAFLKSIGVSDSQEILGLRPGEAICCTHAGDSPGGCGTGKTCASCGAAIAIVTSFSSLGSEERKCVATIWRDGESLDMCLNVRSTHYRIGGQSFLILMIQDVTEQEKWEEIQAVLFKDLRAMATGLVGASGALLAATQAAAMTDTIHRLSKMLEAELKIQQNLMNADAGFLQAELVPVPVADVAVYLQEIFASHPVAVSKHLTLQPAASGALVLSDLPLLVRVLSNMILNAFEASEDGEEVRLWIEEGARVVTFSVWNRQTIPEQISGRIFQRYFSTKARHGRGIGTFMMKYFGEYSLNGKVTFTSSAEGTTFRFAVPRIPASTKKYSRNH